MAELTRQLVEKGFIGNLRYVAQNANMLRTKYRKHLAVRFVDGVAGVVDSGDEELELIDRVTEGKVGRLVTYTTVDRAISVLRSLEKI